MAPQPEERAFDCFRAVATETIITVTERYEEGGLSAVCFQVDNRYLTIGAIAADDTIVVTNDKLLDASQSSLPVLQNCIGMEFGWGWIGVNQQGYPDTAMISFHAVEKGNVVTPYLVFTVGASDLKIGTVCYEK